MISLLTQDELEIENFKHNWENLPDRLRYTTVVSLLDNIENKKELEKIKYIIEYPVAEDHSLDFTTPILFNLKKLNIEINNKLLCFLEKIWLDTHFNSYDLYLFCKDLNFEQFLTISFEDLRTIYSIGIEFKTYWLIDHNQKQQAEEMIKQANKYGYQIIDTDFNLITYLLSK